MAYIDQEENSKPFSNLILVSDSSCLLSNDEDENDLSYEKVLDNYNSTCKQYLN